MTVVYVAGAMRSGTTMAGQMIASSPDTVLVGEIKPVLLEPRRHEACDCGAPRDRCRFWSGVYRGPVDELVAAAGGAYAIRSLPTLLAALLLGRPLPPGAGAVVGHLRLIAAQAGDHVVVDTSKTPVGVVLWRLAGQRVHLVQCVRNPAAVARAQARPEHETGLRAIPRPVSWAVWLVYQTLIGVLSGLADSRTSVTYAELRNRPRLVASRIWSRVGVKPGAGGGAPADFTFGLTHVLAANPRRSQGGQVRIAPLPTGPRRR